MSYEDDLDAEFIQELVESTEFEEKFYNYLAGSDKYQLILYPDPETKEFPTKETIAFLRATAYQNEEKLLYRTEIGNNSIIFSPENHRIGYSPADFLSSFEC